MSFKWAMDIYQADKLCGPRLSTGCLRYPGSGWAFQNDQDERYYLHGISAKGSTSRMRFCQAIDPYFYTNLTHYYDFIKGNC